MAGCKVIKCSDGRWACRFTDPTGQRRTLRAAAYKPAAESVARRIDALIDRRVSGDPMPREVAAWVESIAPQWRAKLTAWGLLDATTTADASPLAEHLDAFEQSFPVAKERRARDLRRRVEALLERVEVVKLSGISRAGVEQGLRDMEKEGSPPNTLRSYRQAVMQFCEWAARPDVRRLDSSPVTTLARIEGGTERERRALAADEQLFLLTWTITADDRFGRNAAGAETWRMTGADRALAYRVTLETGLRSSELASLTRGQFRLEATRPTIVLKAPDEKNRKGSIIVLRPATAAMLRDHLRHKAPVAQAFDLPPVYARAEMLRADLADARASWIKAAGGDAQERKRREESEFLVATDHAGAVVDWHALRVAFITNLARAGVPLQVAQKLARHSDPKLTANVYSKLGEADHAAALDLLPDLDVGPSPEALQATGTDPSATRALQLEGVKGPQVSTTGRIPGRSGQAGNARNSLRIAGNGVNCPQPTASGTKPPPGLEPGTCALQRSCPDAEITGNSSADRDAAGGSATKTDPHLAEVVDSWPVLPAHVRAAVLALVRTAAPGGTDGR